MPERICRAMISKVGRYRFGISQISQGGVHMKIQKIREIARHQGLEAGKAEKIELIKAIQRKEGNFDCFATAHEGVCDQGSCLWRTDCFAAARSSKHS
jgi:hypothetical protein